MKRFLFVATLLLIVASQNIFAESYEDNGFIKKGDLEYMVDFSDSLKQETKSFWVWYKPEEYIELFNGVEIRDDIPISITEKINANAVIDYLLIRHFGEDIVFDSEGKSNIYNVSCFVHVHSGRVYFTNIFFHGNFYKVITEEEILGFIKDFNLIKIKVNDIEKYDEDVYIFYDYGDLNKIFGIE